MVSAETLTKGSEPSTPAANKVVLYPDSAKGVMVMKDEYANLMNMVDKTADKNFLLNGGFSIRQRVAAALTTIPGASLTQRTGWVCDHWSVISGNITSVQFQQVDTGSAPVAEIKARYHALIKQITNTAKVMLVQCVSNVETSRLRGKTVRLSAKIRYGVGVDRNMRIALVQLNSAGTADTIPGIGTSFITAIGANGVDPTLGTNLAYVAPKAGKTPENCTISGNSLLCPIIGTWKKFSGLFDVPADCKNLAFVIWSDTTGSASDDFLIGECQLTEGEEVLDFAPRDDRLELYRCQAFFTKTFAQGTVPVTNAGINTGEHKTKKVVAGATAGRFEEWQFPQIMFKTPTITLYNPAAANAQARDETNTVDCSATATVGITDRQVAITFTGNAATVAEGLIGIHISADAEI